MRNGRDVRGDSRTIAICHSTPDLYASPRFVVRSADHNCRPHLLSMSCAWVQLGARGLSWMGSGWTRICRAALRACSGTQVAPCPPPYAAYRIGRTMYETDSVPADWVHSAHTKHNKSTYSEYSIPSTQRAMPQLWATASLPTFRPPES